MAIKDYYNVLHTNTVTAAGPWTTQASGLPIESPLGVHDKCVLYINVTAISGTGASFVPILEEYDLYSDTWYVAATGTAMTAVGKQRMIVDPLYAVMYRLNWTLAGTTPSVTFACGAWCSSTER